MVPDDHPIPSHRNPTGAARRRCRARTGITSTLLLAAGAFIYARYVEPHRLQTRRLSLVLPRLHPAFDGYRVVHLSDLHLDHHTHRAWLRGVMRRASAERPDLVAITGDFVQFDAPRFAPDLVPLLRELTPRDGVVAVLGNHDHDGGRDAVRAALGAAGVRELANDALTVCRGTAALHIAGVDCVWERRHRLDRVLRRLHPESAAVLLAHEPDFADVSASTGRFDLQLSGHSHGGQVRLPLIGPPRLTWLGEKYPDGLAAAGGMLVYTNRGIGMLPPRVRFLCRPELTVLTLRSPAGTDSAR